LNNVKSLAWIFDSQKGREPGNLMNQIVRILAVIRAVIETNLPLKVADRLQLREELNVVVPVIVPV
jgi:hypothetical protein